jgi:hypothetical protein
MRPGNGLTISRGRWKDQNENAKNPRRIVQKLGDRLLPPPNHRDQAFDAALKSQLDTRLEPGGDGCPDPPIMAAYVERSLSAAERIRLDAHYSNCARCQSVLAAMARAQAGTVNARRLLPVRWRLYGAVAAALAGVSIAVTLIANRHVQYMALSAPKYSAARQVPAKQAPPPAEIALNQPASSAQMEREATYNSAEPKTAALQSPAHAERRLKSQALSKPALQQPPETTRNELAAARPQRDIASSLAIPPQPPAPPAAFPQIAAGAPPPFAPASPQAKGLAVPGTFAGGLAMQSSRLRASTAVAGAPTVSIRTADGIERWRLGPGGIILHREPGGSWQTQSSGVAGTLNAGAAPSPAVCWVVGSNGTVLRTTDGLHWQKAGSPTSSDLVSVFAVNASAATVTAANGQRFATSDGGQTWQRLM